MTTEKNSDNVRPMPARKYMANSRRINSKPLCYSLAGDAALGQRSDFSNILFVQNGSWMGTSFQERAARSPLARPIGSVISVRASKEMIRPYARRVVAFMKNAWLIFRHVSIGNPERENVRTKILRPVPNHSIPVGVLACYPNPTTIRAVYFGIKSFLKRGANSLRITAITAISSFTFSDLKLADSKGCAACQTVANNARLSFSHDVNLLKDLRLWLGSFGVLGTVRAVCIVAQMEAA